MRFFDGLSSKPIKHLTKPCKLIFIKIYINIYFFSSTGFVLHRNSTNKHSKPLKKKILHFKLQFPKLCSPNAPK